MIITGTVGTVYSLARNIPFVKDLEKDIIKFFSTEFLYKLGLKDRPKPPNHVKDVHTFYHSKWAKEKNPEKQAAIDKAIKDGSFLTGTTNGGIPYKSMGGSSISFGIGFINDYFKGNEVEKDFPTWMDIHEKIYSIHRDELNINSFRGGGLWASDYNSERIKEIKIILGLYVYYKENRLELDTKYSEVLGLRNANLKDMTLINDIEKLESLPLQDIPGDRNSSIMQINESQNKLSKNTALWLAVVGFVLFFINK